MWNYILLAEHCNTQFPGGYVFNLAKVVSESKQIASTAEFNIYCAEQRKTQNRLTKPERISSNKKQNTQN